MQFADYFLKSIEWRLPTGQNNNTDEWRQLQHLRTTHLLQSGTNFHIQIVSTMAYSLFVTGVVGIQIYCAFVLLRIMDAPNFVFSGRMSLLTLSLCNIEDFSQTMTHIQYIMGSEVLPPDSERLPLLHLPLSRLHRPLHHLRHENALPRLA
jgi:hypothetical protein